ncbi:MAG TPA: Uma2 family endonuclease [Gemmata sp.]|jgi:Uma2 family endonuclease|nr:Uma2 family endonuclease [Gemmata sp.]
MRHTWTIDQFHHLGDLGMFEARRAMLINGDIIEQRPMSEPHRIALELTADAMRAAFGSGWRVCVQMPLALGQTTDPSPDVAVIAGSVRGTSTHPSTAALVIEVADTSLNYDTTTKAELYATAGIADYWVVDVTGRQLLVFRDPKPIAAGGVAYRTPLTFGIGDSIAPQAVSTSAIRVADLLP